MSTRETDGGPAFPPHSLVFPGQDHSFERREMYWEGMSLRDYFAGQALTLVRDRDNILAIVSGPGDDTPEDKVAVACYMMADAMLKARAK